MAITYADAKALKQELEPAQKPLRICRTCGRTEGDVKFDPRRRVCTPCRGRDYYTRNRAKCIATSKRRYEAKRDEINAKKKQYYIENPDLRRDIQLRGNYGITLADYRQMHTAQDGACVICARKMEMLSVDHCHDTRAVRGLLCPQCNSGIGYFRDDPELLYRAIEYLAASRLRECA